MVHLPHPVFRLAVYYSSVHMQSLQWKAYCLPKKVLTADENASFSSSADRSRCLWEEKHGKRNSSLDMALVPTHNRFFRDPTYLVPQDWGMMNRITGDSKDWTFSRVSRSTCLTGYSVFRCLAYLLFSFSITHVESSWLSVTMVMSRLLYCFKFDNRVNSVVGSSCLTSLPRIL